MINISSDCDADHRSSSPEPATHGMQSIARNGLQALHLHLRSSARNVPAPTLAPLPPPTPLLLLLRKPCEIEMALHEAIMKADC